MQNDNDFEKIKEKMCQPSELPTALSEENMVNILRGKRPKTPVKAVVRRLVAVGVAACLVMGIFTFYDWAVYAPKIMNDTNGLVYAASYDEIGDVMDDYIKSQKVQDFDLHNRVKTKSADVAVNEQAAVGTAFGDSDYSQTNTRTAGIDEADVIKTDGSYLYIFDESAVLHIVTASGEPQSKSMFDVYEYLKNGNETSAVYGGEIYLYGDKVLIACTHSYGDENGIYREETVFIVLDVTDVTAPKAVKKYSFAGQSVESRLLGDRLLSITSYYADYSAFDKKNPETFIPTYSVDDGKATAPAADSIAILGTQKPDSFLTVAQISLTDFTQAPDTLTLFGEACDVYCTQQSLYVYGCYYDEENEKGADTDDPYFSVLKTKIYAFDIGGNIPTFRAVACLNGRLLNTFSLDEYNGNLRVAITANANIVYVLDNNMQVIGKSEPLAENESIYAVRFMGDSAYLVTFYQTDPLYVLDLSNPQAPVCVGELKLPGFSAYLHPVGENLLLGIGQGGTDEGLDGSAKLSLFDVSDPQNPVECDSLVLKDAWFNADYKSVVAMGDGGYLIGYTGYETNPAIDENGDFDYNYYEKNGILHIEIQEGKIVRKTTYDLPVNGYYEYQQCRAAFVNETVFAVNVVYGIGIFAYDVKTGELINSYENYADENARYPYLKLD